MRLYPVLSLRYCPWQKAAVGNPQSSIMKAIKSAPVSTAPHMTSSGDVVSDCAAIMNTVFQENENMSGHASAVAAMVAEMGGRPEIIAAAYLHDVAEDTTPEGESPAIYLEKLGVPESVARIVLIVTRHINGKESYKEFISRILAHGGPDGEAAVLVKRAD